MTLPITPAQYRCLKFAEAQGEVAAWPTMINLRTVDKCRCAGLIETCGRENKPLGFTKYRLTASGKAALLAEEGER